MLEYPSSLNIFLNSLYCHVLKIVHIIFSCFQLNSANLFVWTYRAHKTARIVVEQCIGQLKRRFMCYMERSAKSLQPVRYFTTSAKPDKSQNPSKTVMVTVMKTRMIMKRVTLHRGGTLQIYILGKL